MVEIWFYAIISVILVSLLSFLGIVIIFLKLRKIKTLLLFFMSFSIGALLGDSFIHLLPEAVEASGFTFQISVFVMFGFVLFFLIEKIVHWKHNHSYGLYHKCSTKKKSIIVINLVGDGIHNFIDGIIIGISYFVSIPVGIATTVAVILHEIPQELGDFGVLVYGGLSKTRALFFNFLSGLIALVGVLLILLFGSVVGNYSGIMLPFAAGGFIYIAGSNLIPELHKKIRMKETIIEIIGIILGIVVMVGLLYVG